MAVKQLIEEFEGETVLPFDLNKARTWLLDNQIQDEINFVPVELDTGVIRGLLKRHKAPKGGWDSEPLYVSNIFYANNQTEDWQNLVCAKELLHILDGARVTTREQLRQLTQRLTLPNDLQHLMNDPDYVLVDKFGTAPASALLLPLKAREALKPAYDQGLITAPEIAKQAVMPAQQVRTVMSDNWLELYDLIKSL